jgi:predicted  nucleic acid-binding Zn-ribbon protein
VESAVLGDTAMPNQQEWEQAINDLEHKTTRIKEKIVGIDSEIKNSSTNSVEKLEAEIAELRNSYYEIQARELLGEFDAKQKREIQERIQSAERHLKADSDQLQNMVGIRQALETELKKTEELVPQYQATLDRFEFEQLKHDRDTLVQEVNGLLKQLEALFSKITHYNMHSVALATKILDREYQLKGYPNRSKSNGTDKAHQLAQPFDLNQVKNSLAETISEIISRNLLR